MWRREEVEEGGCESIRRGEARDGVKQIMRGEEGRGGEERREGLGLTHVRVEMGVKQEMRGGEERRGGKGWDSLMCECVCKNSGGGAGKDVAEDRGEGIGLPCETRSCGCGCGCVCGEGAYWQGWELGGGKRVRASDECTLLIMIMF
jgi:hypothetical protein